MLCCLQQAGSSKDIGGVIELLKWNSESHIEQIKVRHEEFRISAKEAAERMGQLSEVLKLPLTDYERGLIDGHRELQKIKSGRWQNEQAGD